MKLREDLEYDFQQELYHSPENIEAATEMFDGIVGGTFYEVQKKSGAKMLKKE